MAAIFTGLPELQLRLADPDEAMMLAEAFDRIGEHYNVTVPPKVKAMVELAAVCSVIYQPRLVAIAQRKRGNAGGVSRSPQTDRRPAPSGTATPASAARPAPVVAETDATRGESVILTGAVDGGRIDLSEKELSAALERPPTITPQDRLSVPKEWQ